MPAEWEIIRDKCRARRRDAIPADLSLPESLVESLPKNRSNVVETSRHFADAEVAIINTTARKIVANIRDKTWSALEVTRAFCKSAAVAQQLVSVPVHAIGTSNALLTQSSTDQLLDRGLFRRGNATRHRSR